MTELSQELVRIAETFAKADAESAAAFHALALNTQQFVDAGLGSLGYSLLQPPHIGEEFCNRLRLENRISILQGLGFSFFLTPSTPPDTVLYVTNPLRVRRQPGLNGEIYAYATPGSQVTYTGHVQRTTRPPICTFCDVPETGLHERDVYARMISSFRWADQ